jgi:cytochrome c oxidase subunit 2
MITPPPDTLEVNVIGRQWMWHLQHSGGQREINTLHVPVGRPVKLTMTSADVIHDFAVPAFRVRQDVLPGRYTTLWFEATQTGTFHLFCAEYCGTNHSAMIGTVVVMEPRDFQRWLSANADGSPADAGRKLFQRLHCVTCHSGESRAKAPLLEGIHGKEIPLEGGGTATADDDYLRESILDPRKKVHDGFRPIMPPYAGQVTEEEMADLLAFLRTLGPGQTPPRVEKSEPKTDMP